MDFFYDIKAPVSADDFYSQDTDRKIEIQVVFGDLSEQEKEEFASYIGGTQLAITKRIYFDGTKLEQKYFAATKQIPILAEIRQLSGKTDKRNRWNKLIDNEILPDISPRSVRGDDPDELMSAYEEAHPDLTEWVEREAQFLGPKNIGGGIIDKYTKFVYVPAVKDVMEDMAEKRGTPMYQLLDALVVRRFQARPEVQQLQKDFEDRVREIYRPENLTEFATLAGDISQTLQLFVPNASLILSTSEPTLPSLPTPSTIPTLTEDEFEGAIDRKGHGLQRALIFSLLQHIAVNEPQKNNPIDEIEEEEKPTVLNNDQTFQGPDLIIAIEEPELYQHPLRARHLSRVLMTMSQEKQIGLGGQNQVLYTTHSSHFVDLSRFSNLRIVRKCKASDGLAAYSTISQYTLDNASQEMARITERPTEDFTADSFHARAYPVMTDLVNEGFFANAVVIVEGLTEVAALITVAEAKNSDWLSKGIAIISAEGKNKIDRPVVIFRGFKIPTYFIFDGDNNIAQEREREKAAIENRKLLRLADAEICDFPKTTIGENHACFQDNFESYCKSEVGEEKFLDLRDQIAQRYGYIKPSHGLKNYDVVERLISELYEQGHSLPVVEQIVEHINGLIQPQTFSE